MEKMAAAFLPDLWLQLSKSKQFHGAVCATWRIPQKCCQLQVGIVVVWEAAELKPAQGHWREPRVSLPAALGRAAPGT